MRDRNKTDLTHRVTKASVSWLDHHGFKPVETEVPMPWVEENQSGWVADLAAVITPTQTELINMKLIPRKPKWPGIREREQPGWEKRREQWDADWNAKRESVDRTMTCVVEVKTSRGDFRKDKKFARSAAADLMYLALAPGIAKQEEWPEGWGILELRGEVMVCLRPPTPRKAETIHQFAIVLNIAIRRDHHTRYGRYKEDQQEFRIRQQERKVESRTNAIARAMLQIVRGQHNSIEEVLDRGGINVSRYMRDELQSVWGVAKQETPA